MKKEVSEWIVAILAYSVFFLIVRIVALQLYPNPIDPLIFILGFFIFTLVVLGL